jgi:hypothetical protein
MVMYPDRDHKIAHLEQQLVHMKTELGHAYRALYAFRGAHVRGERLSDTAAAYQSLTVGAAARFVTEDSLEGAAYFEGKPVDVLHQALKL